MAAFSGSCPSHNSIVDCDLDEELAAGRDGAVRGLFRFRFARRRARGGGAYVL